MLKITALTSGKNTPSSRFRVRQYINILRKYDVNVEESIPWIEKDTLVPLIGKGIRVRYILPFFCFWELLKVVLRLPSIFKANNSDLVWLQREMVAGIILLEFFLKRPYVFDVDDAIWTSKPFGRLSAKLIAKRAAVVIAGNQYLANWFSDYNKFVEIVPTSIDTERFYPDKIGGIDNKFVIGWTGTSVNFCHLYSIQNALSLFINRYKEKVKIKISIVADKKPFFSDIADEFVEFTLWTPETEVSVIQRFDIGLMPLLDNEFTRGKCSFKMLQYMAVGIPVIVSPVGMNKEVLDKGRIGFAAVSLTDWYEAIEWLYRNPSARSAMGKEARNIIMTNYSVEVVSKRLASIFTKTANSSLKHN